MNRPRTVPQLLEAWWSRPQVRLPVYLLLLVLGALLARRLGSVLGMVGAAYALAYLANPVLEGLERRGLRRGWGVLLLTLTLVGVLALLFWQLATQVVSFVYGLPVLADRLTEVLDHALQKPRTGGTNELQHRLAEFLHTKLEDLSKNAGPVLDQVLSSGPSLLGKILGWLGQLGFVLTLALYFAVDYERVGRGLLGVFPRDWQPTLKRLSRDVSVSFGGFIRGQLLVSVGVGILAALGLLALHVPNALALGLLTAVLYLVPFVGMVLATVPPLLQAIPQGSTTLGLVAGLYFLLNQIGGNVLGPVVMGRSTKINPATLLVAVLVGLGLAGALGALLAVPIALLLQRWGQQYWLTSRTYQGQRWMGEVGRREADPKGPPTASEKPPQS
ncbi:AI-2E family transporter [Deinococcus hopiensis]|uniref:Predicted PurR-regulated permease PerM n=1 Tax=Deinococcus hopiensis KR-140 TaxID=695939 RepID=A0A1W1VBT9_9DEIO|nr:AI-2E family transporter [Deinococcus hopiensis]SMB90521.1 Predicted PurR-regulated permease PerM [Deinococcus hopiensis KR-140]